ncbi:unnamed protein product [Heterobilharzia americana]|nr:unnamed protein product [Heterobilharzia americana]CAH8535147.1 unnamed protein product [Heterobilharzia americana]CAH8560963.1 unnamed protein product [Heterobilharzia americana]
MNDPEKVNLDYQKIYGQIIKIIEDIHDFKFQLSSFYKFINIITLKRDIRFLVNLCQTDESLFKASRLSSRQSVQLKLEYCKSLSSKQEYLPCTIQLTGVKHYPTIYSTLTVQTGDISRWRKLMSRTKLSTSEQLVFRANQSLQVPVTSHNITCVIHSTCQEIHMLQTILEYLEILTEQVIGSENRNVNTIDYNDLNNLLCDNVIHICKIMSRLVEYVSRINNRRFMDRIIVHLRHKCTANFFIYLIGKERSRRVQ